MGRYLGCLYVHPNGVTDLGCVLERVFIEVVLSRGRGVWCPQAECYSSVVRAVICGCVVRFSARICVFVFL